MNLPDFKKLLSIKSFRIVIIPEQSGSEAKSKKITLKEISVAVLLYTVVVAFLGYLVISITPLDNIFSSGNSLSSDEVEKIETLNNRLYFLSKELEALKSTNERLKYAIMLGDSSLVDSIEMKIDSIRKKNNIGIEGNIFQIIRKLFYEKKIDDKEELFFIKPVNGFISREFLPEKGHIGIDLVVKTGTPVYAAATGYIIFSDYTSKDGFMIIINHSNDYISVYKHCSSLLKKEREIVLQGELIALSGNSGEITTGPHLHFEIWKNGKPIDPKTVLIKL